MLGDLLAQNLNKKPGDTLTILGETFTITGIFHGGTALETGAVIMPLDEMQTISSRQGKVTAFHVRLRPTPAGESYEQYVAKVQKEIERWRGRRDCRRTFRRRRGQRWRRFDPRAGALLRHLRIEAYSRTNSFDRAFPKAGGPFALIGVVGPMARTVEDVRPCSR